LVLYLECHKSHPVMMAQTTTSMFDCRSLKRYNKRMMELQT